MFIMKKRITTAILAAIMVAASATAASADPNIGGVIIDPVYTVVIPEGILLNDESAGTVRIYGEDEQSNVVISYTEYICVSITESENDFNLVSEEGETLAYTINGKNSIDDLTEIVACDNGETASADLVFDKEEAVYAGSYYDSLTFTVSMGSRVVDLSQTTGSYTAKNHAVLTGTADSSAHITIEDGAAVTLEDCNITSIPNDSEHAWAGITLEGDATLILEGENKVRSGNGNYPGIKSAPNKTLTIKGSGSLEARSNGRAAGIGSGYYMGCGNISIEGGTITAYGGSYGAGIGSSDYYSTCGNITISGGDVTAHGGRCGAGIGSGGGSTNGPYGNACGNITITGGTVHATGGESGPGIGSGDQNLCKDITISGGEVTATGGERGAGIGSGGRDGSYGSYCDNITISGGTVKAFGGNYAAGIGAGGITRNSYRPTCKNISITGGTVTAKGKNSGAAIGTGGYGKCGDITVTNTVTKVTVTKGTDCPNYIGLGNDGLSEGTINIDDDANIVEQD